MMLLHFLLLAAANAAASDKDREPVPYEMDRDFHTKLFSVTVDERHYDHGVIVYPDTKGKWDVTMDLVTDADARDIRADYQLVDELWDGCRAIVEPFEVEEINGAKTYGDSAIFMAFSIKERAVTQFYTGQKRVFTMWATPYVGTISNNLVIEPLFDSEAELYKFNCGVVSWEDANLVEALSYRAMMTTLTKRRRHLCMQMPIGWVARYGLHPDQIAFIEAKEDGHALKDVLIMKDGGKIGWYPPPVAGKMDPEPAAYHTSIVNAGLMENGYPSGLAEIGFQPGHKFSRTSLETHWGFKPGNVIGLATRFKPGHKYWKSVAAMPSKYGSTYMLIANIAFECASFSTSKARDACIPEWLSESGVVTAHILRQPQFKAPFEFEVDGKSYRIVGANWRMTVKSHSAERFVFDVVSGDEWDKSHVIKAHAVCVGLGLLESDEVPPSMPYGDSSKMFRQKAFKPWPRGFALKGRLAEVKPGDKFVKEDGTAWFVFREGTRYMNVNGPSAKKEHWMNVPGVWYCKKGSKPPRDLKNDHGPCKMSKGYDEVRKWMQETQEGKNIESGDSGSSGLAVGLPVAALGYAALQALSKRRREDDDDDEEEAAAARPRRRRRGQRDDEHEA